MPLGDLYSEGRFHKGLFCYEFGGGTYTWRGLFSEFYGSFSCFELGLPAWNKYMAAYQQFEMRLYYNFE